MNAHHEEVPFTLPEGIDDGCWDVLVDTDAPAVKAGERLLSPGDDYNVAGRSLVLLSWQTSEDHEGIDRSDIPKHETVERLIRDANVPLDLPASIESWVPEQQHGAPDVSGGGPPGQPQTRGAGEFEVIFDERPCGRGCSLARRGP